MRTYSILINGKIKASNKKVARLIALSGKFKKKISIEETQESILKRMKNVKLKK